jgi:hypothetical protein
MLMDERATAGMIAAYLYEIAAEHMGLGRRLQLGESSRSVAEILVALRPSLPGTRPPFGRTRDLPARINM